MTKENTMRMIALLLLVAPLAYAAPAPYPIDINSRNPTAPGVSVFRANEITFRASFNDSGTASDLTNTIPFMDWATSNTAAAVSTSSYSFVGSSATGLVDFTFAQAAVNYAPGRYIYEIGVMVGGVPKTYRHGVFVIQGSPVGAGVAAVTWTTNVDWNAITWANLPDYQTAANVASILATASVIDATARTSASNAQTTADAASVTGALALATASSNTAGAALGVTALQAEADTAQSVFARGATVSNVIINLGSENMTTNTYGGHLVILGKSVQQGLTCTASGDSSAALGSASLASGLYSFAIGRGAQATHEASFAWSGFLPPYTSNGSGTFNINPVGGIAGFYVGETNFATFLASYVSKTDTNGWEVGSHASYVTTNSTATLDWTGADIRITDGTHTNSPVTLAQLQESASIYQTWQFWPGSNSTILAGAKAMRSISEGAPPDGSWTNTIASNNQYTVFCSLPADKTSLKAGLYQVNVTMQITSGGGDALSISAEIYTRATNGTETEITAVSGTTPQVITVDALEYVFSLNVTNNTTIAVTDSILVKFKSSGRGGTPDLIITKGFLSVPIPSSQFVSVNDTRYLAALTNAAAFQAAFTNGTTGWFDGVLNGTNGVRVVKNGTNYWWLLP